MKFICLSLCTFCCLHAIAQKPIISYYDYKWKPCEPVKARFYSALLKTDSGWLRRDYYMSSNKLQMQALYLDSACKIYNGNTYYFHPNGNASSIGKKINNKNEGVCMSFYSDGTMSDSATYHNGRAVGNKYSWHRNGGISDSTAHINDSLDVEVSWFDNGTPSEAGYLLGGEMHGKWKFFHRNGQLAATEVYEKGKLLSAEYFNEDGSILADTSKANAKAMFKGGLQDWQNYLTKHLYWPANLEFTNGDMAVVVVDIVIGEDGKPENVEVATPFHPAFDKIALDVVRKSPPWNPGINHNRKVKTYFRQPVTFKQEE